MKSVHPNLKGRILVVDDHDAARESVAAVLRHCGYTVSCLSSAIEALPKLQNETFDVVITDLQMPGMDGLEFIRQIDKQRLGCEVLMITAHATISSAVEAMRSGAFDYLEKPFDANQLEQLVAQAIERRCLRTPGENTEPSKANLEDMSLGMVGTSPAMSLLRERILQIGPTDETVLIRGESGTGKELVARALHAASHRNAAKLVSLNCPALSPQLTESELFGHRRGAFTGADDERIGRFELAEHGTIFLDEITEIDLALQAKLLRVLQERTFERVGCSQTQQANVRVIASTNRDLEAEVAADRFRQDLYYRLAVVPIELPPLRQRGEDVQLLANHFLERASQRLGRPLCQLADDTRELLATYHWPGNIRELENIITRACVLNQGDPITAMELQPWLEQPQQVGGDQPSDSQMPVGTSIDEMERRMIVATLEHFEGHRAKAAEALGIGVRTLSGKLRSYGYAPRAKHFSDSESSNRQIQPIESAVSAPGSVGKAA